MACAKLKVKKNRYFLLSLFSSFLNIAAQSVARKNKQNNSDAFYLPENTRRGRVFSIIQHYFFSLILTTVTAVYLSFVVMNGNLLKYVAVTVQLLQ